MKNVADIYALSPMQELMLLHAKTTDRAHDNLFNQVVYVIDGVLDVGAYQQAWQLMVERHPALRTLFVWQDGKEPLQVVREQVSLPWAEHDWRASSPAEQQEKLIRLLTDDRAQGFDLLLPPAMRLALIQLTDEQYWLVWSSHHLIIDRWCNGILFEEVKRAYEVFVTDSFPALEPAPAYGEYIGWLAVQDEAAAQAFWRAALHDLGARPLPLGTTLNDEAATQAHIEATITADDWADLRRFAAANNLTHSTLVTGAWAVVLAAATGVNDALFGLTVSGRPTDLPNATQTIGCFINNVPLRVRLGDELPTVSWLESLQDQQLELKPYEYASPAQIQTWRGAEAYGPLFDTLVVMQAPIHLAMPSDLNMRFVRGGTQTGYPISLGVVPNATELYLTLTYDPQRVSQQLAEQMMAALTRVLCALAKAQNSSLTIVRQVAQVELPRPRITTPSIQNMDQEPSYQPPRSTTEAQVAQIWAEVLNRPKVSVDARYFDLGGDSIGAVRLCAQIEERLGMRLPLSLLVRNPTVAEMTAELSDETQAPIDPVLQPIKPDGNKPPFFYVHGVFGDVLSFSNVAPLMDAEQPLFGLEAIGLRPEHKPDLTIEAMAARYVATIKRVQPSGPYHIGGFCFGGLVAYEIARQLEQAGERTALLAIIEGSAPVEFHDVQPLHHADRLRIVRHSAPYWAHGNDELGGWRIGDRIRTRFERGQQPLSGTNGKTRRNAETDNLMDFNATRPEIQFKLRDVSYRAVDGYSPQPYDGNVTLIRARAVSISHALLGDIDPQRGWGRLASGGVSIRYVDGNHISILTPPHVTSLAATLAELLHEAQQQNQWG